MNEHKIIHVTESLGLGGTEKSAQILSEELNSRHETSLYSLDGGSRKELLEEAGVDTEVLSEKEMKERFRSERNDVVHFHGDSFSNNLVKTAKNNSRLLCKTTNFGWVDKELASFFDFVFFPSKMTLYRFSKIRKDLYDKNPEKYRLLYYPLIFDVSDEKLSDLDFEEDKNLVGKIGRSAEGKWSDVTLKGFAKVAEDREDFHLVLVSPPESIEKELDELGIRDRVTVLGRISPEEVYKFYNSIDVLAHSSGIGESFGYVIAESLNSGTPVVVDSNPMRDNAQVELVDGSKNGYIANSPEAYSKSLEKAVESDENPSLLEQVNHTKVVDRLEKFYLTRLEDNTKDSLTNPNLTEYKGEYRHRIRNIEQPEPISYKLEVLCWLISERSPLMRPTIYDVLRGFFQPGRKLHKLTGGRLG